MSKKPVQKEETPTTGHTWDGIQEYDNPMPRWWLWLFYATIVWGIGYTIAYPAWPGVKSATAGMLGYSTRAEVAADIAAVDAQNEAINIRLATADMSTLSDDAELNGYAISAGGAVFKTWCAQCHGSGAAGAKGYPNLLDNDWLWGGDIDAITHTVRHGVRNETGEDPRYSEMPAFGRDELLEDAQIDQVVNFVMSLSGEAQAPELVKPGAVVFEENCASCHGETGLGDRDQGAPNLADAIWLFGGSYADIHDTVSNSRFGVMPNWDTRLTEAQIRAVSAYVHQLGGGE
ncbi:cytochrome-c oxidase, cbb3-type subunit III [Cognatishimia sp. SS12]|uniref:cytochrome-c oxidase, cbb3-type subunit III n=1 Tax=Cognatishimia sp. SS12 TaxID=2979465 RepID=UPI00232C0A08|nr:cytochrome-c oxidase, cbb3-type subunit III [Cognatishimia sp. SS12]MDC0739139.1 cytochrome-c oxidase, cbb3-type subunit III [Cognatishimia sp. SS12]